MTTSPRLLPHVTHPYERTSIGACSGEQCKAFTQLDVGDDVSVVDTVRECRGQLMCQAAIQAMNRSLEGEK